MTQQERYRRFVTFQEPLDIPLWGDWVDPYDLWVSQGMPPAPASYEQRFGSRKKNVYMMNYFGLEGKYSAFWGMGRIPVNLGLGPGFEYTEISRDDEHIIARNSDGVIVKRLKENKTTQIAEEYLDHPLHGSSDWPVFRDMHLKKNWPGRYPPEPEWRRIVELCKKRDWVITIDAGSFYGILRNWMGVHGISYALLDEPDWLHEVVDYLSQFYIDILERAVTEIPDIDAALFWEDMCFKTGPLCSPAMFREFFLPGYKKVTDFLKKNGVFSFWVDCDGNIEQLIDLWIEGGVNGFYPMEAAAGMDPLKIKRKYSDRVLLWGGIDKLKIAAGPESIESELVRIKKAADLGGYIPLIDHGVPDIISFKNFSYYNRRRKEILNLQPLPSYNPFLF